MGISSFLNAQINVAIIDTGFCPQNINQVSEIKIQNIFDATSTINQDYCNEFSKKSDLPRYHGQHVLNNFLTNYFGKEKINIFPIIVFNNLGIQKSEYWKNALDYISNQKVDVIISASGLKTGTEYSHLNPKQLWLLSAPRISPYIKKTDKIFPQILSNGKNIFLFGNLVKEKMVDPGLLYQDKTQLFINDSKEKFNGSSYALSLIAPKILSVCNFKDVELFQKCFYENRIKNGDIYLLKNKGE